MRLKKKSSYKNLRVQIYNADRDKHEHFDRKCSRGKYPLISCLI